MIESHSFLDHVQAVLFDKDGTLLDFVGLWGPWLTALEARFQAYLVKAGATKCRPFGHFGLGLTFDANGNPLRYNHLGPMSAGTMEQVETILAWHLWNCGIAWHEALETVRKNIALVEQEFDDTRPVSPLPGLRPFIQELRARGIPLGVVTSDNTSSAHRHLEWLRLADAFPVVMGRDSVSRGKPEPDMVHAACRQFGVDPRGVVLIGDSEIDMEMGRRAGVSLCVQIMPGAEVNVPHGKRWTVRHYTDLLDLCTCT